MSLDEMIGAIRAADGDGDGEDPQLAAATQLRVLRSLEGRARGRHQLAGFLTAAAILFGGTVSWALATGRVTALWAPSPALREPAPEVTPAPPPTRGPERKRKTAIATPLREAPSADSVPESVPPPTPVAPPVPAPAPVAPPVPAPAPAPVALPVPAPAPVAAPLSPAPTRPSPSRAPAPARRPLVVAAPQPAPPPVPVEALYRQAHELHFRGGDPAATLAAWNAYLAAEPDGRFSVDARYNRAIILVRLGRYADARRALEPFARGEVEPEGYRQHEAEQLVERLARHE